MKKAVQQNLKILHSLEEILKNQYEIKVKIPEEKDVHIAIKSMR